MAHSLGFDSSSWNPQTIALSKEFRIVRFDIRGHGRSGAPKGAYSIDRLGRDVLELADALDLPQFAFCGLSLGGMIAQWLGWRAADRLRQLILANTSPFMGPPQSWDDRIDAVHAHGMDAIAELVISRCFAEEFSSKIAKVEPYKQALLANAPDGYAGCCAAIRDMDMRPLLRLIEVPTLVIAGDKDLATPAAHSALLTQSIPNASQITLNAGHCSNIEQPEAFTDALSSFLHSARSK